MVTKKKVEPVKETMLIKEIINSTPKQEYQKIFSDKKEVEYIKYDLNYFTIKRIINNFYLIKLSRFRNINLWQTYCNWFNSKFNTYPSDYLGDTQPEIFESDK